MSTNILMPALSPTMTEGKLARWLKKEGDEIKSGDVLAEIETDKATMEVEAVDEGFLAKIVVSDETEGVPVNAVIGILTATKGEAVDAPKEAPKPAASKEAEPAKAAEAAKARRRRRSRQARRPTGERIFVSPLAKRMAKQAGIDLSTIKGSGPNGRIVKADLDKAGAAPAAAQAAAPAPAASAQACRAARRSSPPRTRRSRTRPCARSSPSACSNPSRPCRISM